jgi:OOP family OmpA-OmpF porin
LTGNVSDEDARTAFPERAQDMFRYWNVEQDLTINEDSPNGFRRFMDQALSELGQLDAGCITLNNRALLVSGSVRSERALTGIKDRFSALSDLGFEVSYDLALPKLSEQAAACQEEANRHVAPGETVLFDFDSDEIHAAGSQLLDEVVEISKLCPDVKILVTGHTDSVGDKDYNIALGERRAEAVVSYMVSKGVDSGRLASVGLGFSQPVADNSTEEGRSQNRRIEFRAREE